MTELTITDKNNCRTYLNQIWGISDKIKYGSISTKVQRNELARKLKRIHDNLATIIFGRTIRGE